MRIKRLELTNWLCFRGSHALHLAPTAYAIVARRANDAESSNFGGKSSLVESIRFALYGTHRHRTEDAWITDGEPEGGVAIEFDDGLQIERSRRRGQSTKLRASMSNFREYTGTEAQSLIAERVGLSEEDFVATCYFEQRQMARLVLADPAARMATVSGWLRLDGLQRAESAARDAALLLQRTVDDLERKGALADEQLRRALEGTTRGVEELREDLASCQEDRDRVDAALAAAQGELVAAEVARAAEEDRARLAAIVAEQESLGSEVVSVDPSVLDRNVVSTRALLDAVIGDARAIATKIGQKQVVAQGEFDGGCPVIDWECPAKAEINARRSQALVELRAARGVDEDLRARQAGAQRAWEGAVAARDDHRRKRDRLKILAEQAARITPTDARASVDPGEVRARVAELRAESTRLAVEQNEIMRRLGEGAHAQTVRKEIDAQLVELRADLDAEREAVVVLGKNGAQRKLAEGVLAEVESGANEILSTCGIGLSVAVKWSREGKGLSDACDQCGRPFPSSARVRRCDGCGAERGPKTINRLEVELSDRSGAAEDLGSMAIQLSASRWLRHDRSSGWQVLVLDEPFGALDRSNRRAFANHLAGMLSRYCSQAFVIAHSPDALSALPGRIEVVREGKYSTVRMVA